MSFFKSLLLLLSAVLIFSCSDDSTNNTGRNARVTIYSQMVNPDVSVTSVKKSGDRIQRDYIDAVTVKKVRILLSRIMMHKDSVADEEDNTLIKTGPFVLEGDYDENIFSITNGELPAGDYNKIKFEIHRFSASEYPDYSGDPDFEDFATSDRFSVIIEGTLTADGKDEDFIYNGTITANITLNFDSVITLEENTETKFKLVFDPNLVFDDNGQIYDPRDPQNANKIDNNIKAALKAEKFFE